MKTIKTKILAATLCILTASLFIVGAIAVYMNYTSVVNSLEQTLSEAVKIAVNQVDRNLQEYRTLVTELAANDYIVENDTDWLPSGLKAIQNRHNLTIVERTNSNGIGMTTGQNISNSEYFIQAKNTGKAYVSDPVAREDDGVLNLFVSAPIMKDGNFDGVLFIGLDANFLCDLVAGIKVGGTGNAAMLNKDGTTIAYADLPTVLEGYNTQNEVKNDPTLERLAALEREMIAGNSGFGDYSYGGKEKFFAYTPVPNTNGWSMDISAVKSEFLQGAVNSVIIILVVIAVCLVIAILLIFRLSNAISKPIHQCVNRIQLLAEGDLKTEVLQINTKDETKHLTDATETIVSTMKGIITDVSWRLQEIAKGNFDTDSRNKDLYLGDFKPMEESMDRIVEQLTVTLANISQAADEVSSGSDQVASGAQALSQGATEQASSIEQLAATINEISGQVERNAQNAQQASQKVADVGGEAGESNMRMKDMLSAMKEINKSSDEIGKIIKTIEDIAFQTNILALNAAVEAARAGDAGKGFAVVADEVRNLANKSAEASKDTSVLIEESIKAIKNGAKIADETAQSMENVVNGVKDVTMTIEEISRASGQQAESISQVTQGIDQISSVVQTNSATAEQSAAASEELSGQADMLKNLVGQFKLKSIDESVLSNKQQPKSDYYETETYDITKSNSKY